MAVAVRSPRAPAFSVAMDEIAPEMNITPLIDVLLVLIVMLILTIPIMTHQVPIDLPAPGPATAATPQHHRVTITANGMLAWDGAPVDRRGFDARLSALVRDPDARLELETAPGARYAVFDATLATIKRAGVERLGFVGNERFADFSETSR